MIVEKGRIISNQNIALDTYEMVIDTNIASHALAGQFVQVQVPTFYLRRPISIHEIVDDHTISLIYKVVGDGTRKMSTLSADEEIDLFGPLGTGFPILDEDVMLIGGGVGVPPLYETAKQYRSNNKDVAVVLGFNDQESVFGKEKFESIGCRVYLATMDGSLGTKGTVIDAINENNLEKRTVLSCGPLPMLKAVSEKYTGYVSLEARMACGIGACMGCVVKDEDGNSYRVCKDGPVFPIGKVVL